MMNRKRARYSLLLISLSWPLLQATPGFAQGHVVLNGPMGSTIPLSGPDFNITANLGKTVGNNLFQSFNQFDLVNHDVATFSGPANIHNILAKVTGGSLSSIDGTIQSTIPGANLFFINPFGVLFGPDSKVLVMGSFAVTSASYVKLADGGRFDAVNPANDVLTTAPVSAFGFSSMPGPISFDHSALTANSGLNFSVIGGNITMNAATIGAPGGRINLISINSAGELALDATGSSGLPDTQGFGRSGFGTITLAGGGGLDADGDNGGGQIVIRGGTLMMQNSELTAETQGAADGKGIDIQVTGDLLIDGGTIRADTIGSGNAGDIRIHAAALSISDGGGINADSSNKGSGGAITINAGTITVNNNSSISANTTGSGPKGHILVDAGSIVLDGLQSGAAGSFGAVGIYAGDFTGGGAAGNIVIHAGSLNILNGAAVGVPLSDLGIPGSIVIDAGDLTLGNSSTIGSPGVGNAGNIRIAARILQVEGNSIIGAPSGEGNGGDITIRVTQTLQVEDNSAISAESGEGNGGNIRITVKGGLQLQNTSTISANSQEGNGGNLNIIAGSAIEVLNSSVSASADKSGGNVTLGAVSAVNLQSGQITANATVGSGGNISIGSPNFLFDPTFTGSADDASQITANSTRGRGGRLRIENGFSHPGTVITASGGTLNGTVTFVGPNLDLTGSVLPLRVSQLDAEAQLQPYCGMELSGNVSSFLVRGKGGVALEPSGASPSFELPPYDSDNETR